MKKILVAEDEQNIREFVVINLKRAGYDCVEAASGEEALRVYEQAGGDFDVAVLDIMMPGSLDGLAVCKELRQKNATIGHHHADGENAGNGQGDGPDDGSRTIM